MYKKKKNSNFVFLSFLSLLLVMKSLSSLVKRKLWELIFNFLIHPSNPSTDPKQKPIIKGTVQVMLMDPPFEKSVVSDPQQDF